MRSSSAALGVVPCIPTTRRAPTRVSSGVAAPAAAGSWAMLIVALFAGCVIALGHALWRKLRGRGGVQPWAPSLILGGYLAVLVLG